jgi:hypothetical protein
MFISLISFWLAVYYPFRETLDPAIDPALDPCFDSALDPDVILACSFSVIYTWHLPILTSG